MIIDFRVRPPYKSFLKTHLFAERQRDPDPVTVNGLSLDLPYYRSFAEKSMDAFIDEMDEAGIDLAVVMGRDSPPPYNGVPNDEVAELTQRYPDHFVGFGSVDGSSGDVALREIERCQQLGFKGIALDNG